MCLLLLGTSSDRRNKELARLNTEYLAMVNLRVSIDGAYQFLLDTENYRMLSSQEYTWRESPLRSGRICEKQDLTMVIENSFSNQFMVI